jgi:hypothetical protein
VFLYYRVKPVVAVRKTVKFDLHRITEHTIILTIIKISNDELHSPVTIVAYNKRRRERERERAVSASASGFISDSC